MRSYSIYGPEKREKCITDQVYEYLSDKNNVSMRKRLEFNLDITNQCDNWYGVLRKNIVFQNNDTGLFFIINHADRENDISEELVSHQLCIGVLKCQYRQGSYGKWESKISPFTYGVKEKDKYFSFRNKMKKVCPKHQQMYFKGNETGRGHILMRLAETKLINEDYGFRDRKGNRILKVDQETYLQRMTESKIALSLPGKEGAFCHRELEAFGIGIPVLMPILMNQYYNNLIPDVHYIAVDNSSLGEIKNYTKEEKSILCDMIKNKYDEVIDDDNYLNEVTQNALLWFEENISFPSNMKLMEKILLEKFNYQL